MKDTIAELEKFWELKGEKNVKMYIDDLSKFTFVPFIGSGMSVPFGCPTWSNFLSKIINDFFELSEREPLIDLLKKEEFLELADKLNDILGNGVVEEQVRNEFGFTDIKRVNKDRNYLSFLKNKSSINTFVTTNFDSVIETSLGFSADKIYLPSNLLKCNDIVDKIRHGESCIIKLHGTASQPDSIILTGKTFEAMYKRENTALQELVDYLWNRTVLLFLGCGLKNDYLVEHLQDLASTKKVNWHYAILPYPNETEIIKRRRELTALKIRPIWYEKGKHEQILIILNLITGDYGLQGSLETNEQKRSSELTVNVNNGNIGTQTMLNIKYLNGNINQ